MTHPALQAINDYMNRHPDLDPRLTSVDVISDGHGGYVATGHIDLVELPSVKCRCCDRDWKDCSG